MNFNPEQLYTYNTLCPVRRAQTTSFIVNSFDRNMIIGTSEGDTLNGTAEDDAIAGGVGNDTLYGGAGNDALDGGSGDDLIWASSDGNNTLSGGEGNDSLNGREGSERLDGGAGDDYLIGRGGDDVFIYGRGSGNDVIERSYNAYNNNPNGTDTVQFGEGLTVDSFDYIGHGLNEGGDLILRIKDTGETLTIKFWFSSWQYQVEKFRFADSSELTAADIGNLAVILPITGTEGDDNLSGRVILGHNNTVYGLGGNDTITGGNGNDTLDGGAGNDFIQVGSYAGSTASYLLIGGEGNDSLYGGYYNSSSTLDGGSGDDLIWANSDGNNTLSGGEGNDSLNGREGSERLDGGAGDDYLIGRGGDDTYVVDSTGDTVTENVSAGIDTVSSSITYTLGANVENLILTGTAVINGTGNELNNSLTGNGAGNTLTGNAGDDTLDGGTGTDSMLGGAGNDTYIRDNTGDVITENANEGTDTIQSSLTYTLGSNLENLTLTGTSAINGTGNILNNVITGNSANNTLSGSTGADTLIGGVGNDTYIVDNTGDVVTENASEGTDRVNSSITYTLGANVENLTLTGTAAINGIGNELNNSITGNSTGNTLSGNAGNDTLNGGTGADTLIGGLGNDTYYVDNTGDVVTENVSEGTDGVSSSITYTLGGNVENLTLSGTSAINGNGNELNNSITGNAAANTLTGNAGNDSLSGGAGADTLIGGTGNDAYTIDNAGDVIIENAGEGTDRVTSSVTYTLSSNVENMTLSGTAVINGTGNELNNSITGNTAANLLTGDAGNDTLTGGAGNDTLDGGAGNDSLVGSTGDDNYLFRRTDGKDTINDYSTTTTDADALQLTDGIASTEPVIVKQNGDLYIFVDGSNYVKIASQFSATTYGIERLEVSDGHYITRSDIESIVNTMSAINNNTGMDVMQKYNAMMSDQTYISTLAATWKQM